MNLIAQIGDLMPPDQQGQSEEVVVGDRTAGKRAAVGLGSVIAAQRKSKAWSREELAEEIGRLYGDEDGKLPISARALRNIEIEGNGRIYSLKLILGALGNVPRKDLDAYFSCLLLGKARKGDSID